MSGVYFLPAGDFHFRHYLPVLKGYPPQYIYEPWNAPESVQKAAKCIVGKDYPVPIVNHAEASKLCMERMKQVYQLLIKRRSAGENDLLDGQVDGHVCELYCCNFSHNLM